MVSPWLNEITAITGVEGVLLASNTGEIIEKIGTDLDRDQQKQIACRVLKIIAAHDLDERAVKEIELIWNDYRILVMGAKSFVLIIFCGSTKALSLLRITMNVVIAHLLEDKKSTKQIKKYASEKRNVLDIQDLEQLEINLISKLQ